ncbi:MAG: hypothetical protein ACTS8S_14200 [Giesbergeria sp.]
MFDAAVVEEGLGQLGKTEQRRGVSGSPDGLGAYVRPDQYAPPTHVPEEPEYHPSQMAGEIDFIEPDDTSSGSATKSAGFTLLFVALCTGIGYAIKGGFGAATGLLLSAGVANGYRAQKWWSSPEPSEKHEAIVSSVFGAGEIFAGIYVGYKAFQMGEKRSK